MCLCFDSHCAWVTTIECLITVYVVTYVYYVQYDGDDGERENTCDEQEHAISFDIAKSRDRYQWQEWCCCQVFFSCTCFVSKKDCVAWATHQSEFETHIELFRYVSHIHDPSCVRTQHRGTVHVYCIWPLCMHVSLSLSLSISLSVCVELAGFDRNDCI